MATSSEGASGGMFNKIGLAPNKSLDAALEAIVNSPTQPLASLSVLAVKAGKTVYHKQFGAKWIDQSNPANSKPADAATMYRIASISKLVATLGVMKLVETGKLKLDEDISKYLSYTFRNPHFADTPITLRQMLSHTSSLRDDGGYYWDGSLKLGLQDVLLPGGVRYGKGAMWAKNAKPGAYFQYANLPWGVIGSVMECVTGERFDRLMRRLILDPMALPGGFHPADLSDADLANVATLYRKRTEVNGKEVWNPGGPWIPQVDDHSKQRPSPRALPDYKIGSNGTLFGPQGNCRLSAAGLAEIMFMLMNEGLHRGKPILKPATVAEMLREQWHHNGKGDKVLRGSNGDPNGEADFGSARRLMNAWGLGNQHFLDITGEANGDRLVQAGGFRAYGHLGDAWGLTSAMVFNPFSRDGMIYLIGGPGFDPETNRGDYSGLYRHEEKILDALYTLAVNPV
ncbi:MAG: serine hydrolase [Aeromicrobium sp.]|nr:serine hydrolase [Burkholderiales bacterium]